MTLGLCSDHCRELDLARRLRRCGVPELYVACTLKNFNAYNTSLQRKLETLRRWAAGDLGKGLYLFGSIGGGKTHLAIAVMRELFSRGIYGHYIENQTFVLRSQATFHRDHSVEDLVNDILGERFLVLDDLGSEQANRLRAAIVIPVGKHGIHTQKAPGCDLESVSRAARPVKPEAGEPSRPDVRIGPIRRRRLPRFARGTWSRSPRAREELTMRSW